MVKSKRQSTQPFSRYMYHWFVTAGQICLWSLWLQLEQWYMELTLESIAFNLLSLQLFCEVSLLPPPRVSYEFANLTFFSQFLGTGQPDYFSNFTVLCTSGMIFSRPGPSLPSAKGGQCSFPSFKYMHTPPPLSKGSHQFLTPPPHCKLFQGDMLGYTPPFPRIPRCFQPANHIRPP